MLLKIICLFILYLWKSILRLKEKILIKLLGKSNVTHTIERYMIRFTLYILEKMQKKRFNVADASNILEVISNELSEIVADNSSRVNSKGSYKD